MDNLLTVSFEAHHAEMNHHRRYEISVGRDLFNDWTVTIRYGRIGLRGQVKRFAGVPDDEMKAVIRDRLRRRLSAPKRIGCAYWITGLSAADGFDAAAWLPGEVIAGFFQPV
jgi:predicted DNA-binding WGR domain protein